MENIVNHHQEIVSDKGNNRDGSVCLKSVTPINLFSICPGKSTPQSRQWSFSYSLGSQVCVCFFPFCTHRKYSSNCKSGLVSNVHNSPSMAKPTLVSSVSENIWKKNPWIVPSLKDLPKDFTGNLNPLLIPCLLPLLTYTILDRTYLQK